NTEIEDQGSYVRLVNYNNSELKRIKTLEAIQNPNCDWFYTANQEDFEKIPGSPIGYWLSSDLFKVFINTPVGEVAPVRKGNSTSNNNRFLRLAHEINRNNHSLRSS